MYVCMYVTIIIKEDKVMSWRGSQEAMGRIEKMGRLNSMQIQYSQLKF